MVDPVGSKPVTPVGGLTPVTKAASVRPVQSSLTGTDEAAPSSIAMMARDMSASAPVDVERVAQIRRAIADGSFPIHPAKVADRLIALKNNWHPNDAS